jgi:tripartite-type tricarboxylate transporter receptor subunit TctC
MRTLFGFWCLVISALAPGALAQDSYPNKAITLVVPVPPGGAADFIARLIGQKLSDVLGQPVVISNRGGAGGTIASDNVAKSAPDGYTLLLNSITTHGIGPHIYSSLPYDSVRDFTPVIFVANLPLIMTINTGHEMKSVPDVIAYAKTNPGKLSFASSGNGGAPHLAGELFQTVAGIKMLHVPYRGSGPAVIDVGAGRVDIMFDAVPSLLPLIQAGKLRPLAAASAARAIRSCRMHRRSMNSASRAWKSRCGTGSRARRVCRSRSCSGSTPSSARSSRRPRSARASPSKAPSPPAARRRTMPRSCARNRRAGARSCAGTTSRSSKGRSARLLVIDRVRPHVGR